MKHGVKLGLATVFDATIAKHHPFLYTIYGLFGNRATLYIGQTHSREGALRRLAQHLSDTDWNTYLQRLSDFYKYEKILLERVDFAAVRFSSQEEWNFDSLEYRIAVEHLVQRNLLNWIDEHKLQIPIVSQTRANAYSNRQYIQEEASRITNALEPWILECYQ